MIFLCSKYVKNCNIFGQILNIWVKLILKKKIKFIFQCLALPKDPQSFGSQNLRCPFSVSQYYRRRTLYHTRFFFKILHSPCCLTIKSRAVDRSTIHFLSTLGMLLIETYQAQYYITTTLGTFFCGTDVTNRDVPLLPCSSVFNQHLMLKN